MTRLHWFVIAYIAATVVAFIVLPALSQLVWGDLVPRLVERLGL